jgi:hypothetical protein
VQRTRALAPLQGDRSQDARLIQTVVSQRATLANCTRWRTLTNGVLRESVALDTEPAPIPDDL